MIKDTTKPQRMLWMDQLRGLAAFFVIAHHFYFAEIKYELFQFFNFGILGVTIFFCISGYVIPISIKESGFVAVKNFAISRFFRLYPAYWLSLFLGTVLLGATYKQIIFNITMFQELFLVKSVIGVYWTLTVELCYYIMISILILTNKLKDKITILLVSISFSFLALAFALVRYYLGIKSPLALPLGLAIMFFMTYCSISLNFYKEEKIKLILPLFIVPLLLISSYFLGYSSDWGFNENPYRFILMNTLGVLVFFNYQRLNIHSNFLIFLGKVSYSSYLLHIPISTLVDSLSINGFYLTILFKFALVYFASWLSYCFIESPFIELARKVRFKH